MTRARPAALALFAVLALAACERDEPRSPSPTTTPKGAPPPTAPPAPARPGTVAPAVAPAPAAVGASCRSGELTLKRIATEAAAGDRVAAFALSSLAPAPCTLNGYPTVTLFDTNGRKLGARVVQTEQAYFESGGPPAAITLSPNGRAVFHLAWGAVPSEAGPCLTATRLQVVPPGGDQALEIEERMEICGGQIRVSPVRAEIAAAPVEAAPRRKPAT